MKQEQEETPAPVVVSCASGALANGELPCEDGLPDASVSLACDPPDGTGQESMRLRVRMRCADAQQRAELRRILDEAAEQCFRVISSERPPEPSGPQEPEDSSQALSPT